MTEYRTYGATQNCKGCRYWSEMIARAYQGPLEALCLSNGEMHGKWKSENLTCEDWASGYLGAIDDPGNDGNIIVTANASGKPTTEAAKPL